MCGIFGIHYNDSSRIVSNGDLVRMGEVLNHRGPDGEGYYIDKNIGLGHKRLAIIDIENGLQPMSSRDGQITISFNGEIYNYIELRAELKNSGFNFETSSDTEVIINAFRKWGNDCFSKFNGMWAIAIWDRKKKNLILSRDRIGEKPLHYAIKSDKTVFASEIKSIINYGIPREYNVEYSEIFLFRNNIPAPYTFYKDIHKVEPGQIVEISTRGIKKTKYWELPFVPESELINDKGIVYQKFQELFFDSIRIRMRSDVSFGAFLSGGLDSTSIVSVMNEYSDLPVNTFTVSSDDKKYDESELARIVAKSFNTNHYEKKVTPVDIDAYLDKIIYYFDEPFGDPSALPMHHIAELASSKVKMVLSGDGGDELLSGYPSFQELKIMNLFMQFPKLIRNLIQYGISQVKRVPNSRLRYKINRVDKIISRSRINFIDRMFDYGSSPITSQIKSITNNIPGIISIEDFTHEYYSAIGEGDDFYKLARIHLTDSLPNDYLVKVDRMSMANSLEVRTPFLDYRLVEFMIGVNKNIKMEGLERKSVLRNTVGKLLPKEILNAPKKGFSVPMKNWFMNDGKVDIKSLLARKGDSINYNVIHDIIRDHGNKQYDYSDFLWKILILNKFIS